MQFDHIFLQPKNLELMKDFLLYALGLELCKRPAFNFPGAWIGLNGKPWFHLVQGSGSNQDMGIIGHIAFRLESAEDLIRRLEEQNIAYHKTVVPGRKEQQIFFAGPEGLTLEAVSNVC